MRCSFAVTRDLYGTQLLGIYMGHQSKAPDNDVPLQLLGIYMVHQSKASANEMFSHVIRELFAHFYDYVKIPDNEDKQKEELERVIENQEAPCVGACDGFIFISSKLKNFCNFKQRYLGCDNGFWIWKLGNQQHLRCSLFKTYRIITKDIFKSRASKQNSRYG